MRISFDLDDTLIPTSPEDFPTEERSLFQYFLGVELIRKGSKELINALQSKGHEVGIYTTSFRSVFKIRLQLATYGVKPNFVINEEMNRKALSHRKISSSKYPPAFGIDLHIDDSRGVEIEGQRWGFRTVIIDKNEMDWGKKVLMGL